MALPSGLFAWSLHPYVGRPAGNRQLPESNLHNSLRPAIAPCPPGTAIGTILAHDRARHQDRRRRRRARPRGAAPRVDRGAARRRRRRGVRGAFPRLVRARVGPPGLLAGRGRRRGGRHDEPGGLRADAAARAATSGTWGYLANAFVLAAHRDRGIGSLLLRALLAYADEQRYVRVVLRPSQRAIPFYRRARVQRGHRPPRPAPAGRAVAVRRRPCSRRAGPPAGRSPARTRRE